MGCSISCSARVEFYLTESLYPHSCGTINSLDQFRGGFAAQFTFVMYKVQPSILLAVEISFAEVQLPSCLPAPAQQEIQEWVPLIQEDCP